MSYDSQFTDTQAAAIIALADAYRAGNLVVRSDLQALAQQYLGEFRGQQTPQQVQLDSGLCTIERIGKINYIVVDTDGGALATADFDELAFSGPNAAVYGDIFLFRAASPSRRIRLIDGGNLSLVGGTAPLNAPDSSLVALICTKTGLFVEFMRYPAITDIAASSETCYIVGDAITTDSQICKCISLSGETLATATVTITDKIGSVQLLVDQGVGTFQIGYFENDDTSVTANDFAAGLSASINADTATTGYTATVLSNVVTITAPTGSGSAGSGYNLTSIDIGTVSAAIVDFSGGSDGTEQDDNLDTITGGVNGPIYIHNAMTANDITLISGGNIVGAALPVTVGPKETKTLVKIDNSTYSVAI